MRRPLFYVALAAIVALGSAAELTTFARSDIAFLLYAAGRVLDGARLYVDLVEINPPLIIGVNIVPVVLSRLFGLSDVLVYRLCTIGLLIGSIALCAWVIDRTRLIEREPLRRRVLLLLTAALFLLPGIDFGQREHLLVALLLPYLFVVMARAASREVPPRAAFGIGLLAGIGLALKPHFLLLWVAIEAYLGWRARRRVPWPEAMGVAAFLVSYGLGIALLTPEYVGLVASVGRAYAGYLHDPALHVLVTAPGTTICWLGVLAAVALLAWSRHREVWVVFALALGSSFLAGVAQQKGWTYHFYPASAFALLLLGIIAADHRRPLPSLVRRLYAAIALASVVTAISWAGVLAMTRTLGRNPVQEQERQQLDQLVRAVRRHAPGGSLYVLSYTIGSSFPLVNYSGAQWASRFPHLWLLEATYQDQLQSPAPLRYHERREMGPAERYLNDAVAEDLARNRPALLLVLEPARDVQDNGLRRLDYVKYFSRDPRIAQLFLDYRFVETAGQYRLYARADAAPVSGEPASGQPPAVEPATADIVHHEIHGAHAIVNDTTFVIKTALFLLVTLLALARERRSRRRRGAAVSERGLPGADRVPDGDVS